MTHRWQDDIIINGPLKGYTGETQPKAITFTPLNTQVLDSGIAHFCSSQARAS